MFLKFRVKAAIAKFITANGLHAETLRFFELGPIDDFFPFVERSGFDANQGAVAIISSTITKGATNGALSELKSHVPLVYRDLVVLWRYCGALCAADERRFGHALIVGSIDGNPFDYADRYDSIQRAIDKYDRDYEKPTPKVPPKEKSIGGKVSTKSFTCSKCGEQQTATIYESVRANNDDLKRKLLNKEIFRHSCTECGANLMLMYSILYHDTDNQLAIWLCNEDETDQLEEAMDEFSTVMPSGYKLRLAYSLDELVEKISIFDSGLHDMLVHMLKISCSKQCEASTDKILFAGMVRKSDGAIDVTLVLPEKGDSMVLKDIKDLTPTVRQWNKLESDLDWVHVSDRTFMPIFKMYKERFQD